MQPAVCKFVLGIKYVAQQIYDVQDDTNYVDVHQNFCHSRDLASQSAIPGAALPPLAAIGALHRDTHPQAREKNHFMNDNFIFQ